MLKNDSNHSLMPLLNVHSKHMTYLVSKNKLYWALNFLAYDFNFFFQISIIFLKLDIVTVIGHFNII